MKCMVINGSPSMEKGNTHHVLMPFIKGMEKGGAAIRPHAHLIRSPQVLATPKTQSVIDAFEEAGFQLVRDGFMNEQTLEAIGQPLISEENLRTQYNQWVESEKNV